MFIELEWQIISFFSNARVGSAAVCGAPMNEEGKKNNNKVFLPLASFFSAFVNTGVKSTKLLMFATFVPLSEEKKHAHKIG